MYELARKVNKKERVVGFYSTGPSIRPNDLRIHEVVSQFLGRPKHLDVDNSSAPPPPGGIFCIIDIRPDRPGLPVTSYRVVEEVSSGSSGSSMIQRTFSHVPVRMGAIEAEEVGVEHLLRDINDPTVSTLASLIKSKTAGLATLAEKLAECHDYLTAIAADPKKKANPDITANLQTILSLLPNLQTHPELIRSMIIKTNDMHMAIYLASLIRSVIALHDLIQNKIQFGSGAKEEDKAKTDTAATDAEEKKEDGAKKTEDSKDTK
jgi:26S proteasome regulatory subunit N8